MQTTAKSLRDLTIEEVSLIPESRLQEIYDVVHFYRVGLGTSPERNAGPIEEFAGSWASVPEDEFEGFLSDVRARRYTG